MRTPRARTSNRRASRGAAVERLHRFEAVATANHAVQPACPDGSTVQKRVTVIGGHEVTVDRETLVDGTTDDAEIETLGDTSTSRTG